MRTDKEAQVRIQEIVKEEDFDPSDPMFKYTGGYPTERSTRGYRREFYIGFYHALKWMLEEEVEKAEVTK